MLFSRVSRFLTFSLTLTIVNKKSRCRFFYLVLCLYLDDDVILMQTCLGMLSAYRPSRQDDFTLCRSVPSRSSEAENKVS